MSQAPKPAVPSAKNETPKKGGFSVGGIIVGVTMAVLAVAMLPTTIILVIGMVPTIVAYFVDTSKERSLGPTVFYLNFAGVLPVLLKLWKQQPNINTAIELLTDPFMLLMMLAPAGFGWILFSYVPIFVSALIRRHAEMRMQTLEDDKQKLIEQWGPEVAGTSVKQVEEPKVNDEAKSGEESFTA